MSYIGPLAVASFPPPTGPPRWITRRITPLLQNEGDSVTIEIECINGVPEQTSLIWKIASGTGGLGGTTSWEPRWHDALAAACAQHGASYTVLSGGTYNATQAGRIDLGPAWDGLPIRVTSTCRLDRRTNVTGSTAENPGVRQMFLQQEIPAGSLGSIQAGNGIPVQMRDISLTPAGTPTIRLQGFLSDGSTWPAVLNEGNQFYLQITTEHIVPGTVVRFYAANVGQGKFTEPFRTAVLRGAQAAGCATYAYTNPGQGPDTGNPARNYGVGPYNGILITFEPEYSNANPVQVPLTVAPQVELEGPRQVDFILQVVEEGDPNRPLQTGGMIASRQIRLTRPTPSWWQVEATTDGTTITYRLLSPGGSSDGQVTLASTNEPPGFLAALQAAADAEFGLAYVDGVFVSTPEWDGELAWQVPHPAAQAGKHVLRLSDAVAPSVIRVMDACVYYAPQVLPAVDPFARGVNLSGGEFGDHTLPGTLPTNYRYPANPEFVSTPPYQILDYWLGKGVQVIRLPVRWERIQRDLFGPLYPDAPFDGDWGTGSSPLAKDMDRIDDIIARCTAAGVAVILDVHNYARFHGANIGMSETATPPAAFYDLWERLANRYAGNPLVWFGLMNEPISFQAPDWKDYAQGVTNAIRARTPALNRILVPGTAYTGAHSWVSVGNAEAMESFYDPAGLDAYVFEVHQYFDADSSGRYGICSLNSRHRLNAATNWARTNGRKLFLGEFMGGSPDVVGQEQCGAEVPAMCAYMAANQDVWAGWTAWGAGWGWPRNYPLLLEPASYADPIDTPQFGMIAPFLTS